jgi:hypothetical protein
MCFRTTSCRNLWQMACLYRHSSICKIVPCSILPTSCWTSGIPFGPCLMSNRYPDHHKCGIFWPAVIPDLNHCDFSGGFLKEKLFPNGPETRGKLVDLCRRIKEDMCCCVITNTRRRLQEVTEEAEATWSIH